MPLLRTGRAIDIGHLPGDREGKVRLKEEGKRRLNVSGVLRILGISTSCYNSFRKHTPSAGQKKKEQWMTEIKTIYEESHKIYGVPKIAARIQQKGNKVNWKTAGKYMRKIGIRACDRKHRTRTTRDLISSAD